MKSRVTDRSEASGGAVLNEPPDKGSSKSSEYGLLEPGVFEREEADALDDEANDDLAAEFTPAELREFLAADHLESHADAGFKERLRKKLWTLVKSRYGSGSSSSDSS